MRSAGGRALRPGTAAAGRRLGGQGTVAPSAGLEKVKGRSGGERAAAGGRGGWSRRLSMGIGGSDLMAQVGRSGRSPRLLLPLLLPPLPLLPLLLPSLPLPLLIVNGSD